LPFPLDFEALYRAHFTYVWRTLCRLGCPRDDLSDAAQDVFLVVYRKLPTFERRSTIPTWLFGICYRHMLGRRRGAVRRLTAPPETVEQVADSSPDQSSVLERGQRQAVLEDILDQLSVEQRAVFTLHELESHDGNAIAEILGIPVGTVHSRLRSAREVFWKEVERRRARERFQRAQTGTR
jgi:RNA polymerase sigma-70 factor (ECF subfamily)